VTNRYVYKEQGISTNIDLLKSYLRGKSDIQGSLAVKVRCPFTVVNRMHDVDVFFYLSRFRLFWDYSIEFN